MLPLQDGIATFFSICPSTIIRRFVFGYCRLCPRETQSTTNSKGEYLNWKYSASLQITSREEENEAKDWDILAT